LQVALHGVLDGRQPHLLQMAGRHRREWLIGDVGERWAAPQRERLAGPPCGRQLLEAPDVDIVGGHA
jgi:hypothetical protein